MAKTTPELKQFGDLTPADLDRHPVWLACHAEDEGEPWYNETNEETFRPWIGPLPVAPSDGMLLVRARLKLKDGSVYRGMITPAFKQADLGAIQPQIFVGNDRFRFWGGMFGVRPEEKAAFYARIGKAPGRHFPNTVRRRSRINDRYGLRQHRWILPVPTHKHG